MTKTNKQMCVLFRAFSTLFIIVIFIIFASGCDGKTPEASGDKDVYYTVTFNTNGANELPPVTVISGNTVTVDSPKRDGYLFIGWYTDAELNTPFILGSSVITENTILHAGWEKSEIPPVDYTIKFDSEEFADMIAVGGKIPPLPAPTKSGYTFGGWWISLTNDPDNLSYECKEGMTLSGNVILFAVWIDNPVSLKLQSPTVNITEGAIGWSSVNGAIAYAVRIISPEGAVVFDETLIDTVKSFEFSLSGTYTIEVTAIAADSSNNSDTIVKHFDAYPFFENAELEFAELSDGTCALKSVQNISEVTTLFIPESHNGMTVTAILEDALYSAVMLKRISIPDTVKVIPVNELKECRALREITIRSANETITPIYSSFNGALVRNDNGTFYLELLPSAYVGEYTVPSCVDIIASRAFPYSLHLTKLNISSRVARIESEAFFHCKGLFEISFLDGGDEELVIEDSAFVGLDALEIINFPSRLKSVPLESLEFCKSLSAINVSDGGTVYASVDGMLTGADKHTIIYAPFAIGKDIIIPGGIIAIGERAFADRSYITSLVISDSVTEIGSGAFSGCVSLVSVVFDSRNTDIAFGSRIFFGCTSLVEIDIPETVKSYAPYMFENTGFTSFSFPENITSVNIEGLFAGCTRLESFSFHKNVDGVLGAYFFKDCIALKSVDLAYIRSLGELAVTDKVTLWNVYDTSLVSGAFYGCTALESIDLSSVYNIGAYAFYGCSKLKDIKFPDAMDSVGDYAFAYCSSLERVDLRHIDALSNSLADSFGFGAYVFAHCTALAEVVLTTVDIEILYDGIFVGCTSLARVDFPSIICLMGLYASPFRGMNSNTIVKFSVPYYNAENMPKDFEIYFTASDIYTDNYVWYKDADCIIVDAFGMALLPDGSTCPLEEHPDYSPYVED